MDSKQFNQLYSTYYKNVYSYSIFLLKNKEEAEDVTSETFLRLYSYPDFTKLYNIKAWLITVARNLIYDKFKKKPTVNLGDDENGILEQIPDESALSNFTQVDESLVTIVKDELNNIEELSKEIIVLKVWEEFQFVDIANTLGLNLSTVKLKYYRGIEKIKNNISVKTKLTERESAGLITGAISQLSLQPENQPEISFSVDLYNRIINLKNMDNLSNIENGAKPDSNLIKLNSNKLFLLGILTVFLLAGLFTVNYFYNGNQNNIQDDNEDEELEESRQDEGSENEVIELEEKFVPQTIAEWNTFQTPCNLDLGYPNSTKPIVLSDQNTYKWVTNSYYSEGGSAFIKRNAYINRLGLYQYNNVFPNGVPGDDLRYKMQIECYSKPENVSNLEDLKLYIEEQIKNVNASLNDPNFFTAKFNATEKKWGLDILPYSIEGGPGVRFVNNYYILRENNLLSISYSLGENLDINEQLSFSFQNIRFKKDNKINFTYVSNIKTYESETYSDLKFNYDSNFWNISITNPKYNNGLNSEEITLTTSGTNYGFDGAKLVIKTEPQGIFGFGPGECTTTQPEQISESIFLFTPTPATKSYVRGERIIDPNNQSENCIFIYPLIHTSNFRAGDYEFFNGFLDPNSFVKSITNITLEYGYGRAKQEADNVVISLNENVK